MIKENGSSQDAAVASPPCAAVPSAWQPIETAPKFTHVLLWFPEGEHVIALMGPRAGAWECVGYFAPVGAEPTHWMPLPPSPGLSDGGEAVKASQHRTNQNTEAS